ncbi:MAG: DUF4058 family protein [Pirellulaceae bacterium]
MKSPFPGVDPYLEQHWGDIHTSLMVYIRDQITEQLPSDLQARVEESVSVDEDEALRWIYPDVKVIEQPKSSSSSAVAIAEATVAEPLIIPVPSELPTQRHIEIVDRSSGNRVVTAIELLSPVNKEDGLGRQAYRRKQLDYIAAGVNLVEIDFIRAGTFVVAAPQTGIPLAKRTPYVVCIRRVQRPDEAEIIAVAIDKPVPNFRIPLRPTDGDIVLQLQPLLDDCYRRGRYASIDYSQPPRPPLDERATIWANQLLCDLKHRPS